MYNNIPECYRTSYNYYFEGEEETIEKEERDEEDES